MIDNSSAIRPRPVIFAESLLWASAAIAAFFTLIAYVGFLPFRIPGDTVISNFLAVAFIGLCAAKIGSGRNWARWLMLVVFMFGSLMLPLALVLAPQLVGSMPPLLVGVGVLQFVIQLAALVLVFVPSGSVWFQAPAKRHTRNDKL